MRLHGYPPQSASFTRRTDAKAWAAQTEAALREGRYFPTREAKRHTFNELADRCLEHVFRRRPHAYPKQKQLLSWWRAQLGNYSLSAITPALISQERDALLAENLGDEKAPKHRSPSTANRYLAALSKAMSEAVREYHWIHENPVRRVAKESESQGRVRFLSDVERDRLLEACRRSALKELELVVMLALTTGMRRGEILGLRWQDVDLQRRQAVLHNTKNRERRTAPLMPQVVDLLRGHAKVRRLDTDFVFPQPGRDRPLDVARWFNAAVKRAKIDDFRFHDLRHTAASYLAMSGATPPEIAAVLGHKTLAMVKRYAHLSDAHTSGVVERMVQKFLPGPHQRKERST